MTEKIKHIIEIKTVNTSMILAAGEKLYQCYYGAKVDNANDIVENLKEMLPACSTFGGDDNTAALRITHSDGNLSTELVYIKHSVRNIDTNVTETTIELKDKYYPVYINLYYCSYENQDIIEKWVDIRHEEAEITLNEYPSAELSFQNIYTNYYLTTLSGLWEREHSLIEEELQLGKKVLDNRYGTWSSFGFNPSFMLSLNEPATEDSGQVIAGALTWSGAWKITFDYNLGKLFYDGNNRSVLSIIAGVNDFAADYKLDKGVVFITPKFIQTFSNNGKGQASRNLHKWARKYSLRDGDKERPILLNSWEGSYFTFDEKKLTSMMDGLSDMGGEMFVLDDGWFGNKYPRNNDRAGLGDWQVNKNKLPNGIAGLCVATEERNLKFGIWIEPEMVNPESELYEQHPEWVIQQKHRDKILYRNQLVLDLSNPEVQNFIYNSIAKLLDENPKIAYIKWDCNRSLTNVGSNYLPEDRQTNLWFDYVKGLYCIYEKLSKNYPNVMIQACASGGGRIDFGILKYCHEFWTSDNTDALDRIFIQWGTSFIYPAISMAAHVSACPNHQTGRTLPLKFRFDVAMAGRLGLELNPKDLSKEETNYVRSAVKTYKRIRPIVQFGDIYRLNSPYKNDYSALAYISEDRLNVVLFVFKIDGIGRNIKIEVSLKELDLQKIYAIKEINISDENLHISSKESTYNGKNIKIDLSGDYDSAVLELKQA